MTTGRKWTPPGWVDPEAPQSPEMVVRVPHDPILRLALIRLGVLTAEDIRRAEAEFLAVTAQEVKRDDVPGRSAVSGD